MNIIFAIDRYLYVYENVTQPQPEWWYKKYAEENVRIERKSLKKD